LGETVNVTLRRISVMTIALLALLAVTATAALAQQYPPPRGLALACERSGNEVVCVLAGAQANDTCVATATQNGRTVDTDTQTTANDGTASFDLTLADSSAATIAVNCERSGSDSDVVAAAAVGTPTAPGTPVPAGRTLAMTGGEVGTLLLVAFGLLGAGLLTLRRREDRKVAGA
jgi:hypothetical protein